VSDGGAERGPLAEPEELAIEIAHERRPVA
jgi:hypothetical protein